MLVGVLATIFGTIGKLKPSLFMALPFPISFLCWICFEHPNHLYLMPDPWLGDEAKTWTKPNDLIVSVGAKCGTTWMLYCSHQIRTKGTDDDDKLFYEISVGTPWPDLRQSRHGTWEEQKPRFNTSSTVCSST